MKAPRVEFDLDDLNDLALTDDVDMMALEHREVWSRVAIQYEGLEKPVPIPEPWLGQFQFRGVLADDVGLDEAYQVVSAAYFQSVAP